MALVLHEQQYLPMYARRSPIPLPRPIHSGRPSADYPWHWSVTMLSFSDDNPQMSGIGTFALDQLLSEQQ